MFALQRDEFPQQFKVITEHEFDGFADMAKVWPKLCEFRIEVEAGVGATVKDVLILYSTALPFWSWS